MVQGICGDPVRIDFSSADASTAAALTVYNAEGVARTLAADERIQLAVVLLSKVATLTVTIFDDVDASGTIGAGERLHATVASGNNTAIGDPASAEGLTGGKGRMPKVLASGAGQVNITGIGYIVKG